MCTLTFTIIINDLGITNRGYSELQAQGPFMIINLDLQNFSDGVKLEVAQVVDVLQTLTFMIPKRMKCEEKLISQLRQSD